ncbi:MAG: L,D-transpeptidase family protein, partial [Candidatus Zixiibacteriota bacterium]
MPNLLICNMYYMGRENICKILILSLFFILVGVNIIYPGEFKKNQLEYSRVREAYAEKEELIRRFFEAQNIAYPSVNIFIRAFKYEQLLELWAWSETDSLYKLIKSYNICVLSGELGPKRRKGDFQIPEGFYYINLFNPMSKFHLSMQLNYPNESDRILSDKNKPGGLIFIHGNCVTIGCIPIRDEYIKELYIAAVEAKDNGQEKIPVHIFPCRMDSIRLNKIKSISPGKSKHQFWDNLEPIYKYFEENKQL